MRYIKEMPNLKDKLSYFLGSKYHSIGTRRYIALAGIEGGGIGPGRERLYLAQQVNHKGRGISEPFGIEVLTISGPIPKVDELKIKILHASPKDKHVKERQFMDLCMILKV